jgi:ankyrin repeat protein
MNKQIFLSACSAGHLDLVKKCAGNILNSKKNNGLVLSARHGHLGIVKYLIGSGCDPKRRDNAALVEAVKYGHFDVVKYLVDCGCDPRVNNSHVLLLCVRNSRWLMAGYFLNLGCKINYDWEIVVEQEARKGNLESIKLIMDNGHCCVSTYTYSIIYAAAKRGFVDIVKYLVSIAYNSQYHYGCVLMKIEWYNFKISRYLLEITDKRTKYKCSKKYSYVANYFVSQNTLCVNHNKKKHNVLKHILRPKSLRMQMILIA